MIMLRAGRPRIRSSAAEPDFFQRLYRNFPSRMYLPGREGGRLINLSPEPDLKMSDSTSPTPSCLNGVHRKKFTFNPGLFPGSMLAWA